MGRGRGGGGQSVRVEAGAWPGEVVCVGVHGAAPRRRGCAACAGVRSVCGRARGRAA